MSIFQAISLGILQGLTEFLPISSSGHLVIAQTLSGFSQPGVLFEVVLHAGTVASILVYFRKAIFKLNQKYLLMLVLASMPAFVIGYFFQDFFEGLFKSLNVVGMALVVTALINYLTDRTKSESKSITFGSSFLIGIAQAFAIIPGISRSGATIFSASKLGLSKEKAAEFSFLLSVPAVVAANILQISKYGLIDNGGVISFIFGFLAAFITGLFAIELVISFLEKRRFKVFAVYCLLLGIFVLLSQ